MKANKKNDLPFLYTPSTWQDTTSKEHTVRNQAKAETPFPELLKANRSNPSVLYFENLLDRASCMSASYIYVEPEDTVFRVRYRTSIELNEEIIPKNETSFDIQELLSVIHGRGDKSISIEASCTLQVNLQTEHYEVCVMPLRTAWGLSLTIGLNKSIRTAPMLDELGIPQFVLQQLREVLREKSGFMLLNGPNTIAKQLTRLAMLQDLNTPNRKIISLEETPRVQIPRVSHVRMSEDNITEQNIAQYILQQAPEICSTDGPVKNEILTPFLKATLNNTMLLATHHAPTAIDVLEQLLILGGNKYVVAQSLKGILTQQKLSRVCPDCKKVHHLNTTEKHWIRQNFLGKPIVDGSFTMGEGCKKCSNTGLFSSCEIYELIRNSEQLREAIVDGSRSSLTTAISLRSDFRSLRQKAFSLASRGIVPLQQVMLI